MLASLELDFGSATSALDLARPPNHSPTSSALVSFWESGFDWVFQNPLWRPFTVRNKPLEMAVTRPECIRSPFP